MAITKERKRELVAQYGDILGQADGFVVIEYNRMTVAEMEDLRAKMRGASGEFYVTKNTLFRIALEQAAWPVPEDLLLGPVGIAFGKGSLPSVAKEVINFAKDREERFKIKGGVMAGSIFAAGDIDAVSNLPTLDELRAQLIGLVVAPATGLVSTLQAANSQVVNVLQAYLDDRNKGDDAAPAA